MVAVGSRYARVAIMSGDAEDTMQTPGSKIICNRQGSGRNDLGVSHNIHSRESRRFVSTNSLAI